MKKFKLAIVFSYQQNCIVLHKTVKMGSDFQEKSVNYKAFCIEKTCKQNIFVKNLSLLCV